MLTLIVLVLVLVVLTSMRLPDWLAFVAAIGAAIVARPYLPVFDFEANTDMIIAITMGLFLLPYWLGPLVVYATQRSSASPTFDAYDPARHAVPPSVTIALKESSSALTAAGFTSVGDFFQTGFIANMTSRVTLFEKTATRQEAIVVGMYMNAEPTRLIAHHVEVMARFTDGRTLLVNNSKVTGAFAAVPGKTLEQFPDVRDPRRIARLHERLLAEVRDPAAIREIDRGRDAAGYLSQAVIRELDQQISTGYLRLDRAANAYRPTAKGAALMTWKQLPPFSTIHRARIRRRAAQLLARLGVTEPDAAPATVPALRKKVAWPAVGLLMLVIGYAASADTIASSSPQRSPAEPMSISADFDVPADFPGAVRALEALTGTTAAQLTVMDSLGFPVKTNGATVGIPDDRVESLLLAAQPIFHQQGFYLFRHEPNYGIGGASDEIGLVPLREQFAVVQLIGTNGVNFDLSTTDVIAWLKALERDAPFVLTGIGYDHVEGRFLRPVGADADSLAKRLHSFCPDVVDQGTGSVKELANEIGRLNTFFCWWD